MPAGTCRARDEPGRGPGPPTRRRSRPVTLARRDQLAARTATGTSDSLKVPLPSSPLPLDPQQSTWLVDNSAQKPKSPPTAWVAFVILRTDTGTSEELKVPLPRSPLPPYPQQSR